MATQTLNMHTSNVVDSMAARDVKQRNSLPRAVCTTTIQRISQTGTCEELADEVIVEEPITIMVDKVGSFTVMCTPADLEALAVGFIYSEGMIQDAGDVMAVLTKEGLPNVIGVEVQRSGQLRIQRNLVVASSCGMCGVRNIQKMLAALPACGNALKVASELLFAVADKLRSMQRMFSVTGAAHAAGLFTADGTIVAFAEDIGRHNALDKAIGKCLLSGRSPKGCGVVLSGRVSLEMVTKAARAGIELLVAVSGVSSHAVTAAHQWNITICGFLREGRYNIYTHPSRILLDTDGRYLHAQ